MADTLTPDHFIDTIVHAARALGKIDLYGQRGLTMVSVTEIEAMAMMLAAFEMRQLPPGAAAPSDASALMSFDAFEFLSTRF